MTRDIAIGNATASFDTGAFLTDLRRRVAFRTESQEPGRGDILRAYLEQEMKPVLTALGFTSQLFENPVAGAGPFLVAQRHESDDLPTVLSYGHGDVVRGYDAQWRSGLSPWDVTIEGDRWYRQWKRWSYGEPTWYFLRLQGEHIQFFNERRQLIDAAIFAPASRKA